MWVHATSCFSILRLGIDLAIPRSKREEAHDLDHIMMDAMLEGFDTGVSCLCMHVCFIINLVYIMHAGTLNVFFFWP